MLTIRDLKMTLGGRTLFENASFQVNYGDRVALVGPNGAGKTTLFSIILKQKEPDAGVVERDEWTMVGYLPQEGEAHGRGNRAGCGHRPGGRIAAAGKAAARTGSGGRRVQRRNIWRRTPSTTR